MLFTKNIFTLDIYFIIDVKSLVVYKERFGSKCRIEEATFPILVEQIRHKFQTKLCV